MFLMFLFTYMNENVNSYVVLGGEIEHRFRRCFYCCCRQHGLLFVNYICIIFIFCIINILLCKGYFNYSYIKSHYGLQGARAPLSPLPSPSTPSQEKIYSALRSP